MIPQILINPFYPVKPFTSLYSSILFLLYSYQPPIVHSPYGSQENLKKHFENMQIWHNMHFNSSL